MSRCNRKPLILVADDETHILHVLTLKLGQAGCDVLTAEDGRQALQLAQEHPVDLIISDHQMPWLNGIDLARELAADGRTAHVPVLMLTARGYNIAPRHLAGTRIVAMLSKPFSPAELADTVRRLLADPQATTDAPARDDVIESPLA
jgi:two-component system, OmpR family, alkaline phosphatase synthesis response regulator PhoP